MFNTYNKGKPIVKPIILDLKSDGYANIPAANTASGSDPSHPNDKIILNVLPAII